MDFYCHKGETIRQVTTDQALEDFFTDVKATGLIAQPNWVELK